MLQVDNLSPSATLTSAANTASVASTAGNFTDCILKKKVPISGLETWLVSRNQKEASSCMYTVFAEAIRGEKFVASQTVS